LFGFGLSSSISRAPFRRNLNLQESTPTVFEPVWAQEKESTMEHAARRICTDEVSPVTELAFLPSIEG